MKKICMILIVCALMLCLPILTESYAACSVTYFADSGLIESKTYTEPDEFGNVYYFYQNEPFYTDGSGIKYGRLSKQVLAHPGPYGEIGYNYEYYEGSSVIKNKYCYKNADYSNPSNPVLTDSVVRYSYDEMGRLNGIFPGDIKDRYSFTYSWNDPSTGQMTEKWWTDYNGDGQMELCRTIIRENGSDYDLTHRDSWNIGFSRIYWQGGLYKYDALERLIRINNDSTGGYRIFEYWGDTDTKKKEVLYSILDMPIETIGYYESGFQEYKTYFNTNIQKYETDVYYDATWYLKAKVFTTPDQYGNVYYEYKKENFYPNFGGYPYGRLEKQIRAAQDSDGAMAYIYEYFSGTDVVKNKRLFRTGDCSDPLNPVIAGYILTYGYFTDSGIMESKTYAIPDLFGNVYYLYKNEQFYLDPITGSHWGRLEKQVMAAPSGDGAIAYQYEYFYSYKGRQETDRVSKKYAYGSADYSDPSHPVLGDLKIAYSFDWNGVLTQKIITDPDPLHTGDVVEYDYDSSFKMIKKFLIPANLFFTNIGLLVIRN